MPSDGEVRERKIGLDAFSQRPFGLIERQLRGLLATALVLGLPALPLLWGTVGSPWRDRWPIAVQVVDAVSAGIVLIFGLMVLALPFVRMRQKYRATSFSQNALTLEQMKAAIPGLDQPFEAVGRYVASLARETQKVGALPEQVRWRAAALMVAGVLSLLSPWIYGLLLQPMLWGVPNYITELVGTFFNSIGNLLGLALFVLAYRAMQPRADRLQAHDVRPPVLLLRSFLDDKVKVPQRVRWWPLPANQTAVRLEQVIAERMGMAGPFIAIGDPHEGLPQFGAARVYLSDDNWQAQVLQWMASARAIALMAGNTPWVQWEMRQVLDGGFTGKLVLYVPPGARSRDC